MRSKRPQRRTRRGAGLVCFAAAATLVGLASCQEPTQVYLLLRSDMPCGLPTSEGYGVREVRIFVAPDEATLRSRIQSGIAGATVASCKGPGELGTIALVRENSDHVYVKVIASLDQRLPGGSQAPKRDVADCPSEGGNEEASARCLVSSRHFQYALHNTQYLPITLEESCVPQWWQCPSGKTCIDGACQSEDVPLSSVAPPFTPKQRADAGTDGALADGEVADVAMPPDAGAADYPVDLSLGDFHTCALYNRGDVRCWGLGVNGAIGQGSTANVGLNKAEMEALPRVDLPKNDPAKAIAAGGLRTCATLESGRVMCWGWDGGEFGVPGGVLGYTALVPEQRGDQPGEIATLPSSGVLVGKVMTHVSASLGGHTCAWSDANNVWCWGVNGQGQLGVGDTNDRMGGPSGLNLPSPISLGGSNSAAVQVATGTRHSCAIVPPTGKVMCWGSNSSPQLGVLGAESSNPRSTTPVDVHLPPFQVSQIGAGHVHTCALAKRSAAPDALLSVRCWGTNDYGQLGTDSPVYYGGVAGNYGTYDVGSMSSLPEVVFPQGATADQIAVGPFHNCARMQPDHTKVVCWGRNNAGQLGDGAKGDTLVRGNSAGNSVASATPLSFPSPVLRLAAGGDNVSGRSHTCALLEDHSMWCWGNNGDRLPTTMPRFGQLGVASGDSDVLVPTKVVAPRLSP